MQCFILITGRKTWLFRWEIKHHCIVSFVPLAPFLLFITFLVVQRLNGKRKVNSVPKKHAGPIVFCLSKIVLFLSAKNPHHFFSIKMESAPGVREARGKEIRDARVRFDVFKAGQHSAVECFFTWRVL